MKIEKVRNVKTPSIGTKKSAGIDFFIPEDLEWECKTLFPGQSILIPSGIKAEIPKNHALIAFNKSGVATKRNLIVGACVVDEDYQGEIHIHLFNNGRKDVTVTAGEKIVQFIIVPVYYAESIDVVENLFTEVSERGEGAFGSTGTT